MPRFSRSLLPAAFLLLLFSCKNDRPLFKLVKPEKSGINFNNTIVETDSINVLDFANVYNGGGVGIADFNGDGLPDIYFTGNMVANQLYLNKGGLKFENITTKAGVDGQGKWCRGVSIVDINHDGKQDIYVSASVLADKSKRENILYINQGNDPQGNPRFMDMAKEYGLNDTTHTTQAAFFDYDNDGDLDVYLLVNEIVDGLYPNKFRPVLKDGSFPSTGRLYRNDFNDSLGHAFFTNVSKEANILTEGYGHGVSITDINQDGWKDIYVTNDYLSSNILYINNGDGTFTDRLQDYFKHGSANAMGHDFSDINNDGLLDLIELDMNPEDNFRKKMMLNANSYQTYQNSDQFGYQYQYVRNTLQLNRGPRINEGDSLGDPVFSEIAFFSGVAETDWSWTPMVADFDNDGFRDIIITNGFPKDVTDHDFVTYRDEAYMIASKKDLLAQIPEVKLPNYAFRNRGDLRFDNKTRDWGMDLQSFSNGAAYADLDGDGDLDYVVNNINDIAFLYENTADEQKKEPHHFLKVKLEGTGKNKDGLGAWIEVYARNGNKLVYEHFPCKGYLSNHDPVAHFGLGAANGIDSLVVTWPDRKVQKLYKLPADTLLKLDYSAAASTATAQPLLASNTLFTEITGSAGIRHIQQEIDYIDFNVQKLLPHKFSEYGPALAAGDLNGDGTDDFVVGGSYSFSTRMYFQQADGRFVARDLVPGADQYTKRWEDMGILVFDADNDRDNDLYISSGGYENESNSASYMDRLWINDGKGNFSYDSLAMPAPTISKSCVRAADFDKDGDLDLFVAGRVDPWHYPRPVSSLLFRNDSKDGRARFTDITSTVAPSLDKIGLVCDATWTDFDNDGWLDLVLAGEWMPVTFLRNEKGTLKKYEASGIQDQPGWWTSVLPADLNNDGLMDYVMGNMGQNSYYRASQEEPVRIYASDFDRNGIYDAVPSLYLPDKMHDPVRKEFPAQIRDDLTKQLIEMRNKFKTYQQFAKATMPELFSKEQLDSAIILKAVNFRSVALVNNGKGGFVMKPLPSEAQFSTLNGMVADDFDGDGNLDLVVNGNDFGTEVSVGRYDALNGLYLKGVGDGTFLPASIQQSGIFIPGNGKALVKLRSQSGNYLLLASQNRGPVKLYTAKKLAAGYLAEPDDQYALIRLKDGRERKQELQYGASFLSQSSRFLSGETVNQVTIFKTNGSKRTIK